MGCSRHCSPAGSRRIGHSPADRILAVDLIQFSAATRDEDCALLVDLLSPRVPIAISQAAIAALGRLADPSGARTVARGLEKLCSPHCAARSSISCSAVGPGPCRCSRRSRPHELHPARSVRPSATCLLSHRDPETRRRAQTAFSHVEHSRQTVVDAYLARTSIMKGRPRRRESRFHEGLRHVPSAGRCGCRGRSQCSGH